MEKPLEPPHTDGQPIKEYIALRLAQGVDPRALVMDLKQKGIPLQASQKLVVHVERVIKRARRPFYLRRMARGGAVFLSALFISLLWFESAREFGGPAIIFPGVALVGLLDFLWGLDSWMGTR